MYLDEGITSSIVCDGEPQGILGLVNLHLLLLPFNVSEDEILQADLST